MGIELRKGRRYLYRRERVNGRLQAVYVGALCPLTEQCYRAIREQERLRKQSERTATESLGQWAADVLEAGETFDRLADRIYRAVMHLTGHRLHKRSEWRRTHGVTPMAKVEELLPRTERPKPAMIVTVGHTAEVQQLLDRAATGDTSVLPAIRQLFADPAMNYRDNLGAVEFWARMRLVRIAAGDNVAVQEAVGAKVLEHRNKLLEECGPAPSFAELMAAARVSHNWLTVHILEMKLAQHDATSRNAETLSKQLTRAERRLQASLKALTVLRRLRRPVVLAGVNFEHGLRVLSGQPNEAEDEK